jgi:hypothetical protein
VREFNLVNLNDFLQQIVYLTQLKQQKMKKITFIFLMVVGVQNGYAQQATDQKDDNIYDHYLGAQINQLVMHLFNSSANSIGTGNPYLITYSMNNKKTAWGLRIGIGANSINTSSANTNGTTTTNNNDVQLRVGIEKTFEITKKWVAGTGLDVVFNYNNDNATNTQSLYDTTTITTKTMVATYGGGPFVKLNYHLSSKILLGTEFSYYYVAGTNNQTVDYVRLNGSMSPTTSETKSNPSYSRGNINLPIVLYILLRF